MFGYIAAGYDDIDEQETNRYREVYCGVCHAIKEDYGQPSRMCLSYDLTFFALLFNSLYEPEESHDAKKCALHPTQAQTFIQTPYSRYASHLTIALAYHQCLDNWHDDKSVKALGGLKVLQKPYEQAKERLPHECALIETAIKEMSALETDEHTAPDEVANRFGQLLGALFAYKNDHWSGLMYELGYNLGRFIYLMDAAIDYDDDKAQGSYNPLVPLDIAPSERKTLLMGIMAQVTAVFEKLPLVQDVHLLRSVLYAGVWQQFNKKFEEEMSGAYV